jgi:translation initiation factor IF-1
MALLAGSFGLQTAFGQVSTYDAQASKARAKVESLGNNARVEVKLRDKTKVKGYLSARTADSFTVSGKTGTTTTVSYSEVDEVKKPGGGLSTKTWIIIGAAAVGTVVTWIIVKPAFCDGGAQTRGIC